MNAPSKLTDVAVAVITRPDGSFLLARRPEGKPYAGYWEFPGGKVEPNESVRAALTREIKEELGLTIELKGLIGENEYVASDPNTGKKRKHVVYFLGVSPFDEVKLQEEKGGLDDARWFRLRDALDLNFYEDILPIVTKGIEQLSKQ